MKFNDSSLVGHREALCDESSAHGGFRELVELVVGEPCQYATFPHSTVTHSDSLDLLDWLLY